jgi:toxin ParE1/3/4
VTRYRLTPAARRDIESIWDYTVDHWGTRQAENYLRTIQAAIERAASDPLLGRSRDAIRVGYRSYSVDSHLVFYVPRSGHIDVIRVLHQRMDYNHHL